MREWVFVVVLAALLIFFISPLASEFPDGLEKTAEELEAPEEQQAPFVALLDYSVPLSAVVGSIIVFLLVVALLWPMASKNN